jgi:hypothetical protein
MSNFSPNFKFKICQKFKISQPKVINCHLIGDFCLANFKFLTAFKFKIRREIGFKSSKQLITFAWLILIFSYKILA